MLNFKNTPTRSSNISQKFVYTPLTPAVVVFASNLHMLATDITVPTPLHLMRTTMCFVLDSSYWSDPVHGGSKGGREGGTGTTPLPQSEVWRPTGAQLKFLVSVNGHLSVP